jgi:hypothetical protein
LPESLLDSVDESLLVLLPLFDRVEFVSALVDGVLGAAPALVVASALGAEVCAIDTPPARAAAAARMVKVFLVAFIF